MGSCVGCTGGSGALMRDRKKADARNDTASVSKAIGARRTWIKAPPIDGPSTKDNDLLPWNSALAGTYSWRWTTDTYTVLHEMSKTTDREPTMKVTMKSCARV